MTLISSIFCDQHFQWNLKFVETISRTYDDFSACRQNQRKQMTDEQHQMQAAGIWTTVTQITRWQHDIMSCRQLRSQARRLQHCFRRMSCISIMKRP